MGIEAAGIISLIVIGGIFIGLWKLLGMLRKRDNDFFDYERDYDEAIEHRREPKPCIDNKSAESEKV